MGLTLLRKLCCFAGPSHPSRVPACPSPTLADPVPTFVSSRLPRLLLLLCVLLWTGCARRTPPGSIVRSIGFQGNGSAFGASSDYKLRQAIEQGHSPAFAWLAPSRRVALDRGTLDLDAWRLETWYAHRGFFDARFLAWDVVQVRPSNERRGPIVRITGYVEPGPASKVRELEFIGMETGGAPLIRLLEKQAALQEGARFDLEALDATVALARSRLREQSYAYVKVRPQVEAWPEGREGEEAGLDQPHVDVRIEAQLGPSCVFGEVHVTGDTSLPRRLILDEVEIEEGAPYKVSSITRTQQKLFSLGTFSVVNIVPELRYDEDGNPDPVVPVRIELAESLFRQLKVGGGIGIEDARQQVHVGAELSHVNVFNRLWRLTVGAGVGYASVAEWTELGDLGLGGMISEGGPIADAKVRLSIPRFPVHRWRWENEVSFELGVEEQYRFASPQATTSLVWQMSRKWSSQYGYKVRYYDYFDSTLPGSAGPTELVGRDLGLDFSDPYLLSMIFQQLKYDSRDDILNPRRGTYAVLDLAEAGGPFQGQFTFVKATVDGRIYRPMPRIFGWRQQVTLTGRLAGGTAIPLGSGDDAKVPFAERLFVGGSTTVRGWANQHLGPYIYECDVAGTEEIEVCSSAVAQPQPEPDQDGDGDSDLIYIGGRAALYGGLEARGYWANGFGIAVFSDFGRAWDGAGVASVDDLLARLRQMSVTAGVGLRYRTMIGPIRFDVARRLDNFPMFSEENRWAVHLALSEAW